MFSYTIFVFIGTGILVGLSLLAPIYSILSKRIASQDARLDALENPPKKPRKQRKPKEEAKP